MKKKKLICHSFFVISMSSLFLCFKVVKEDPSALESWAALGVCMGSLDQQAAAEVCQAHVLQLTQRRDGALRKKKQEQQRQPAPAGPEAKSVHVSLA
jgi:hypothetical protein